MKRGNGNSNSSRLKKGRRRWKTAFEVPDDGQRRIVELIEKLEAESRGQLLSLGLHTVGVDGTKQPATDPVATQDGGRPVTSSRYRGSVSPSEWPTRR